MISSGTCHRPQAIKQSPNEKYDSALTRKLSDFEQFGIQFIAIRTSGCDAMIQFEVCSFRYRNICVWRLTCGLGSSAVEPKLGEEKWKLGEATIKSLQDFAKSKVSKRF